MNKIIKKLIKLGYPVKVVSPSEIIIQEGEKTEQTLHRTLEGYVADNYVDEQMFIEDEERVLETMEFTFLTPLPNIVEV